MSTPTLRNQSTALERASQTNDDSFNFDQWAKEVKRQMIASIKKREYKD